MGAEPVSQFNLDDAKANLSRIIERVEHGEEIAISRADTCGEGDPHARKPGRSTYGILKGRVTVADDWDSGEVNDAIADEFDGTT
ncbi:Prevent host death protein, Phd antitoxin |uniref:type II toxin-antitoxin system Phd/YefM family antitoxin n=1 Tax=Alloactinosynnema sp. L-07 TaxID=1653480 RepID=UPI00065EF9DE|nr:hypothetical protein [Alloactinosynnema sp. L-07]CRK58889.1 Prevent host death protein, Phd antitoxin \